MVLVNPVIQGLLEHLCMLVVLFAWKSVMQIYSIYISPLKNLGDAWVAEGGVLDESILNSFCGKLRIKQIYTPVYLYILKLII